MAATGERRYGVYDGVWGHRLGVIMELMLCLEPAEVLL